jgi:HlyD family secretion protein
MVVAMVGAIATGSAIVYTISHSSIATPPSPAPFPAIQAVTALGRLEPEGEVIQVAPSSQGNRIGQLLVKQGDRVKAGQVIAFLDTHDRLQAALERAQQQVQIARTRLAQVEAGAKTGEINAQKATIQRLQAQLVEDTAARDAIVARLQAEVNNAQLEYQRYDSLYREGAVSASLRDSKRLTLDATSEQLREARANRSQTAATLTAQLYEAEATLDRIAEVRPVDVNVARAEVANAEAAVQQAQAELDLATIRAPEAGQILKIHTRPGEIVDAQKGIVSLGQTDQMYAVAEVYESDLPKVRVGQVARIMSTSLPNELQGVVEEVGLEIAKKDVLNTDPAADIDARVVEVKIRLNSADSKQVAGLTNMKVKVAIGI